MSQISGMGWLALLYWYANERHCQYLPSHVFGLVFLDTLWVLTCHMGLVGVSK